MNRCGVMYRCFAKNVSGFPLYTELLFTEGVEEDIITKSALQKLNAFDGVLVEYEEDLVETNKCGQMHIQNLFITIQGAKPIVLETAVKVSTEGLKKINKAVAWLTGFSTITTILNAGTSGFLRPAEAKAPLKTDKIGLTYLSLQILKNAKEKKFSSYEDLLISIEKGPLRYQKTKEAELENLKHIQLLDLIEGVVSLTEQGVRVLGTYYPSTTPAVSGKKSKKDNPNGKKMVELKEYPASSGIPGLSDTAESVMKVMLGEKQITKTRLSDVLYTQGIYNMHNRISKSVDLLVKQGHLFSSVKGITFKLMPDDSLFGIKGYEPSGSTPTIEGMDISIVKRKTVETPTQNGGNLKLREEKIKENKKIAELAALPEDLFTLENIQRDPEKFSNDISIYYRNTLPENMEGRRRAGSELLQVVLFELGIFLDADTIDKTRSNATFGKILKDYFA